MLLEAMGPDMPDGLSCSRDGQAYTDSALTT
jgi:hypothetical protein